MEGGLLFTAPIFSRKGSYKHRDKASGEPKFISKGDMKIEKKNWVDAISPSFFSYVSVLNKKTTVI